MDVNQKAQGISAFVGAYALLLSGAAYLFLTRLSGSGVRSTEATVYVVVVAGLYLVGAVIVLTQLRPFASFLLRRPLLPLFWLSGAASYVHLAPYSPQTVLPLFAMFLGTTTIGAWAAFALRPDQVWNGALKLVALVLLVHWTAYPMMSSQVDYDLLDRASILGIQPYGGGFGHKNLAGAFFGMAFVLTSISAVARGGLLRWLLTIGALFSLVAANAASGLMSSLLALLLLGWYVLLRRAPALALVATLAVAAITLWVFNGGWDAILTLAGRDASLTGRAPLFALWPYFFWQRPILGYGFGGFFHSPAAAELLALLPQRSNVSTFESGYLEALLQFGTLGFVLLLAILWKALLNAHWAFSLPDRYTGLAPLGALAFILIHSLSSTELMLHNHFFPATVVYLFYLRPSDAATHLPRDERMPSAKSRAIVSIE